MGEFIREYNFYLNEGVIILAALVGLLSYRKYKNTIVKYFIYFLIYVVFVELLGYYPGIGIYYESFSWITTLTKGTIFEENFLWYDIFWTIGSAVFISLYFSRLLENELNKRVLKNLTKLFILFSIIYFAFNYEVYYNNDLKMINFSGVFIIVLSIVLYFFEILSSDKIITFYKSINFYIASAFFMWFLIKTPLSFYQIYYSTADWNFVFLRRDINLFFNLFMYLTFILSLLCCKAQNV